jgi:hypothetical protein
VGDQGDLLVNLTILGLIVLAELAIRSWSTCFATAGRDGAAWDDLHLHAGDDAGPAALILLRHAGVPDSGMGQLAEEMPGSAIGGYFNR